MVTVLAAALSGCNPEVAEVTAQCPKQACTPSAKFVYITASVVGSPAIAGFAVNADTGALTPTSAPPLPLAGVTTAELGNNLSGLYADPAGQRLFAAVSTASAQVVSFSVAQDGALSQLSSVSTGNSLSSATMAPDGNHLYVGTVNGPGGVFVVAVAADGTLTIGTQFVTAIASMMAVDASRQFLLGVQSTSTVLMLALNAVTGEPTLPGDPSSVLATGSAQSMGIDPYSQAVLAFTATSMEVLQFTPGSPPTAVTVGSPIALTGCSNPIVPVFQPFGNFVYFNCTGGTTGKRFFVDRSTSAPALTGGADIPETLGGGRTALGISANGKFLYHVTNGATAINGYAIDPATGALSPLPGSPFNLDAGTTALGGLAAF